jgi:hypothetical protein
MAQTLATLRTESQQRCNQENRTLVGTPEWNRYINEAIGELYDLVTSSYPHYYLSSFPFTLAGSNQQSISALTPLFYKLRGLDYLFAGNAKPMSVHPLSFLERNKYGNLNFAGNYTLWYNPQPPTLVADGDTLDFILDVWSEFIPVTAAIAGAMKEESPTDDLLARKAQIIARINAAAPNRDGEPGQAADLTSWAPGDSGRRYMLEGGNLIIVGSDDGDWA